MAKQDYKEGIQTDIREVNIDGVMKKVKVTYTMGYYDTCDLPKGMYTANIMSEEVMEDSNDRA